MPLQFVENQRQLTSGRKKAMSVTVGLLLAIIAVSPTPIFHMKGWYFNTVPAGKYTVPSASGAVGLKKRNEE